MGITEHIEGDECKFAAWTGRTPVVENKMILKVVLLSLCVLFEQEGASFYRAQQVFSYLFLY